jgi:hypothetical protein
MNSSFHGARDASMIVTLQAGCKQRLESRYSLIWLTLLFLGVLAITIAQAPITDNDSGSYLAMSSFRALGYPLFLKILSMKGFNLSGISWTQALLYAAATAVLVRVFVLRLGILAGLGIAVGLLLNPHLTRYQFTILTEGPWMSILLLWASALVTLFYARAHFIQHAIVLGVLTGLAFAVRPASLAMAPVLLLAPLLLYRKQTPRIVAGAAIAALVAFMATAGLERGAHRIVHGESQTDQMAYLLFARSLMIEDSRSASDTAFPRLTKALARDYGQVHKFLRRETDIRVRQFLNVRYEAIAHFAFRPPEFQSIVDNANGDEMKVLRQFGVDRILANKTAFLVRGFEHFLGMWTIFRVSTPSGAAALQEFVGRHGSLPYANLDPALRPDISVRPLAVVLQSGLWAAGAFLTLQMIILGGMFLVRRPLSRTSLLNLAVILTVQGSYLAIAMLNTSIERFSISYLPLIYVSLMITAAQLAAYFWNRFSLSRTSAENTAV